MSLVIVAKCFIPPPPLEVFDSGLIATDAKNAYDVLSTWFDRPDNPPAPFDGCGFTIKIDEPLDPDGEVSYACLGSPGPGIDAVVGNYALPMRLKEGVWSITASIEATSSRDFPTDLDGTFKNIYTQFLASGFTYVDPVMPFIAQDDGDLSVTFEAWVPPLSSDPLDACSCIWPTRQYLGWGESDPTTGIWQWQTANVRFTGFWVSDFPP